MENGNEKPFGKEAEKSSSESQNIEVNSNISHTRVSVNEALVNLSDRLEAGMLEYLSRFPKDGLDESKTERFIGEILETIRDIGQFIERMHSTRKPLSQELSVRLKDMREIMGDEFVSKFITSVYPVEKTASEIIDKTVDPDNGPDYLGDVNYESDNLRNDLESLLEEMVNTRNSHRSFLENFPVYKNFDYQRAVRYELFKKMEEEDSEAAALYVLMCEKYDELIKKPENGASDEEIKNLLIMQVKMAFDILFNSIGGQSYMVFEMDREFEGLLGEDHFEKLYNVLRVYRVCLLAVERLREVKKLLAAG